jgi:hypothetical protein
MQLRADQEQEGGMGIEQAFDVYATNLTLCKPEAQGIFVCPFCRRCFRKEDASHKPPQIIFAHCVPSSLGGRLTALACAECDNRAGYEIDVHLANRLETDSFFRGESPDERRVWLTAAGQRVRANYRITKDSTGLFKQDIVLDAKRSAPGQCEELRAALESGAALRHPLRLTERMRMTFNMDISRIAMLRAAFLFMFRSFGYAYVLHENLNRLREQFVRPRDAIIPGRPIIGLVPDSILTNSVCLITSPEAFRAFLVILSFRTDGGTQLTQGIIMPGLGPDADSVYERIRDHQVTNDSLALRYASIDSQLGRLADPERTWLANELWNELMGDDTLTPESVPS